jgi:hypothetical protein
MLQLLKINSEENILSDNKEITNAFNKFYIHVAKNLNIELTSTYIASLLLRKIKFDNVREMKVTPVSEVEIKYTVISLESRDSAGYDGISNEILKHFMNCINKPLTYTCNFLLTTGIFLERCKFAIAWPIYKKGGKNCNKLLQANVIISSLVQNSKNNTVQKIEKHLESNNSLAAEQFGFRKVVNVESAIFILTDNILTSLNQRHQTGGV